VDLDHVESVRASFDRLWPLNRKFAELFYARLFELKPEARTLFPEDIEQQKVKLTAMLATIVGALDRPEMFTSIVEHLGRQHARFGVTGADYPIVGDALMWSLGRTLGMQLTPEARLGWTELFERVRLSMLRGAGFS
jgi:hemoglobin-like flavoprotein